MDNTLPGLDTLGMYINSLSAASWPKFMYFFMLNKAGIALPDQTYAVETNDGLKIIMRQNKLADMETFLEIFLGQPYFSRLPKSVRNKAKPTVLDIGAHIGLFSLYACSTLKMPKVYAYEPDMSNFNLMKENIRANNLAGRIVPLNLAVGGTRGKVKLYTSKSSVSFSTVRAGNDARGREGYKLVTSTTMSEILKNVGHVDILKMDSEGSEWGMIKEMRDRDFDVDYICMEYHEVGGRKRGEMAEFLKKKGFEIELRDKDLGRGSGIIFATKV